MIPDYDATATGCPWGTRRRYCAGFYKHGSCSECKDALESEIDADDGTERKEK